MSCERGAAGEIGNGASRAGGSSRRELAAVVVFSCSPSCPPLIGGYAVYILPQYMLFGMLAMSLAILWG